MKIIILGAGRVGATLAHYLTQEDNDITLIDQDADALQQIEEYADVRTLLGHGAHPNMLEQAGIQDADMLIAVTNSDETNMIACHVASLFRTPTKIARIRASEFTTHPALFTEQGIHVDLIISPEQLVAESIEQIIAHPGSLQVLPFAGERVLLVVVRAQQGAILVGKPINKIVSFFQDELSPKIIAIYRSQQLIALNQDTVIQAGDEVFFLAAHHQSRQMIHLLYTQSKPYQRILIAGGGHIGSRLARTLENQYKTKLIEQNPIRARQIAETLTNTIVLTGDTAEKNLLLNENIENTDVFCALTDDDEANIMASLLAKKLGVRKVMTLINRSSYVELIEEGEIDIVISPKQTTLSGFLRHIRKGDIVQGHTLRRGAAEALEMIAHGDAKTSRIVGRSIRMLALPKTITIGAIVRDNKVIMAHDELVIESQDHVILFMARAQDIHQVESLFQVNIGFF